MKLFPAIDIIDKKAVRLTKGDFNRKEIYYNEVLEAFELFKNAEYLHVVDLDAAKYGSSGNFDEIKKLLAKKIFVEVGGGIRDEAAIVKYLEAGASRVILGTAALLDFGFAESAIKKYGAKIAVGVDARDGLVSVRGWLETSGQNAREFCAALDSIGADAIIYTDISRDGAQSGIDSGFYAGLQSALSAKIIASGGVSSIGDLASLKEAGVDGAILGKALYAGAIDFEEALAVVG
jgi:phosphoribosylformimino-5-aminoimidazole carboxamide ribotide isomerase